MTKYIPYAIAALVALAGIMQGGNAIYSHVYNSGVKSCELAQKDEQIKSLAKSAQHIIDEQAKLQNIEDIIRGDKNNIKIKSPILMRTLVRVRECEGKTSC